MKKKAGRRFPARSLSEMKEETALPTPTLSHKRLKFRRPGLDLLRTSEIRGQVRELLTDPAHSTDEERVSRALVFVCLVACSDASARLEAEPAELQAFFLFHRRTIAELLADAAGEEMVIAALEVDP